MRFDQSIYNYLISRGSFPIKKTFLHYEFSGGSMCNMYAINLARYHMNPDVKRKGIKGHPQSVIFASDVVSYTSILDSVFKTSGFLLTRHAIYIQQFCHGIASCVRIILFSMLQKVCKRCYFSRSQFKIFFKSLDGTFG